MRAGFRETDSSCGYEIWQLGATAGDPFAGKFADVRFHKEINGNGAEYAGAIRDLWKPLNEELIKKGSRKGVALVLGDVSRRNLTVVRLDHPRFS